jgi:hypothetical protein
LPKGTTSLETVETKSYNKKPFFMVKFSEVLGSTTYVCHVNSSTGTANDWPNVSMLFLQHSELPCWLNQLQSMGRKKLNWTTTTTERDFIW